MLCISRAKLGYFALTLPVVGRIHNLDRFQTLVAGRCNWTGKTHHLLEKPWFPGMQTPGNSSINSVRFVRYSTMVYTLTISRLCLRTVDVEPTLKLHVSPMLLASTRNLRFTLQWCFAETITEQNSGVTVKQRWPESHFLTPTPLLFQNFWIRIRKFFNLRIRLLFRLRL